jgi:GNAT superfamily N-acetyltransferase
VRRFLAERTEAGLAANSVRIIHATLRTTLAEGVRDELVERNVASIVRGPRIDHEEVRPWSLDEAATFLAAASAHRLSALFAVGVAVGLRRGELLALAWEDVDLDRGILRVRRTVQAFLATYAEEAKRPQQYWRNCVVHAHRLLAVRDGEPVGVASVEMIEGAPQSADFHDLWVTPEARNTGVASRPVQIAADQAIQDGCTKLNSWASTENGRAIGFAVNAGFRFDVRTSDHSSQEQRIWRPGNRASAISRQRPRCGGHLDTISAHLEARPPLTKHTAAYGGTRVDEWSPVRRGIACGERLPSPLVDDVINDVHRLGNSLIRGYGP